MHRSNKIFPIISFSKNINNSIYQYLKNAVYLRSFNINYSDTTQSYLSHYATRKLFIEILLKQEVKRP